MYRKAKYIYDKIKFMGPYFFLNNKSNRTKLLYVLAGYKPQLWDIVFSRINAFCPKDIDVCIISSGVYSKKLLEYCKKYKWSYLSTLWNKLTVAQNIAIRHFPKAQWIYKLDEDMFITEGFFESLMDTYRLVEKESYVGYVGPLIPIHSYGMHKYMELEEIEKKFYSENKKFVKKLGGQSRLENPVLFSDELAEFMWGHCKQIDEDAMRYKNKNYGYERVSTRFGICAILYKRELWEKMEAFNVGKGNGGGYEEDQIIKYCAIHSYATVCALDSLCFHFGFSYQEKYLYSIYRLNSFKFKLKYEREKND